MSDIDLLVLVDGDNRDRNAARVRNRYESLRRIIPMLAEGGLALYHPEEFRALYTHCPFYQHRFDSGATVNHHSIRSSTRSSKPASKTRGSM